MTRYEVSKKDIKALNNKLKKIDVSMIRNLDKELGYTAAMISLKAKKDAPVDTSFLKDSINFGKSAKGIYVEASADYAAYQEFGTKYMDAQPYFYDNAKIEIKQLIKRLQNKLRRLL